MNSSSLRERTIFGLLWSFSERVFRRGMGVLFSILLAWLLVPEDFGLVAMLTACLAFGNVFVEAGLSDALIRMKQPSQVDLSTVFFFNLFASILLFFGLFFSAPLVAEFFAQPRLELLVQVGSLVVFFTALSTVQKCVFVRALNFKVQMRVSAPAAFLSGLVAVLLAFLGWGVWAVVVQMLLQAMLTALFYWLLSDWRPSMVFSFKSMAVTFRFGGFLLLARLSNVPFNQMYVIVITKFFSAHIAGLYFFADRVRNLVLNQVVASIQAVTYPVLASIQDSDEKLKDGYRTVITWSSFLLCPVLVFFVVLAPSFVSVVLPERWHESGEYLQLIFIAGIFYPLHASNLNILKVKGRSDLVFGLGLLKKATAVIILFISFQWGITGILCGQILHSLLSYIPNSYYSSRLIAYSSREQLADFLPSLLLAAVVAAPAFWMAPLLGLHPALSLVVLGSGMTLAYLLLAWAFKMRGFAAVEQLARTGGMALKARRGS